MEGESLSHFPNYPIVPSPNQKISKTYFLLTQAESQLVPESNRNQFSKDGETSVWQGKHKIIYLTPQKASKTKISENVFVTASEGTAHDNDYLGNLSDFLTSAYVFNRKSVRNALPQIHLAETIPHVQLVLNLVLAKNRAKEWANGRGDVQGSPAYFQKIAREFAATHNLGITIIKGQELVEQGFRLMHAVGRASSKQPIFVNLSYKGYPESEQWQVWVGKGVCFDSGGLNIKSTAGIKDMFLDKHGAISILSAFQAVVEEKLKINLTVSLGFVENFIGPNSFRTSDIIKSRKGLTVEITNTDMQGRLVLADCMHWTQQKYKTIALIELSTLTGAIVTALGHSRAGLFTNNRSLYKELRAVGEQVHEEIWLMPLGEEHKKVIQPKHCDLLTGGGSTAASSSVAAAFLWNFVEEGVKWVHLDIAGTNIVQGEGTGYGARLLLQYARTHSKN